MSGLDRQDRVILTELQKGIPLEPRPFRRVAEIAGISEKELIERLKRLQQKGYIRRFGGIFDVQKFGIASTLVGMKIKGDVSYAAEVINQYPGVTHNYQREHAFNLWFTLMASSPREIENILSEIKEKVAPEMALNLPALRKHKVQVYLDFTGQERG